MYLIIVWFIIFKFGGKMDELVKKIAPFNFVTLKNGLLSVCLDTASYKKEIFAERYQDGIMGSGYDWDRIANFVVRKYGIRQKGYIYFDSEADMFCALSNHFEVLKEFVLKLKEVCDNDEKLRKIIVELW